MQPKRVDWAVGFETDRQFGGVGPINLNSGDPRSECENALLSASFALVVRHKKC
jgi:hypothetical protein